MLTGLAVDALVDGENVLAVAVLQATADSGDLRFDLTPEAIGSG